MLHKTTILQLSTPILLCDVFTPEEASFFHAFMMTKVDSIYVSVDLNHYNYPWLILTTKQAALQSHQNAILIICLVKGFQCHSNQSQQHFVT